MILTPGTHLGPFEIVAPLGAGGMGEVFRARDTKLGRDVALKVLPDAFASQADRVSRFRREAQVLAALNHANIAAIFGLEESGTTTALVLELVEGPTLADRLRKGPIPFDEALSIAKQIAEALEAAHEKGIVHRDLKPANIKITPDGKVKVLDFGLAKIFADEGTNTALSNSPTMMSAASTPGMILGTAAYMSPEQARGKPADKRTDIWAFGVVLFEMLTGSTAFGGETVTDILGAIVHKEPDWQKLPAEIPAHIRRLIRRCLEKDPKRRLRDIGDAAAEMEGQEAVPFTDTGLAKRTLRRGTLLPILAAVFFAAMAFTLGVMFFRQSTVQQQVIRLALLPPEKSTINALAISPDGRRIAFTAADDSGKNHLWLRALDSLVPQQMRDSEGARDPFWSPDGRFIAFFADTKLKKVDASGGSPQTICNVSNNQGGPQGGTWNREGVILFSVEPFHPEPLYRVSAAGGEPEPVKTLEPSSDINHHHWPTFLPDGRHFLYFAGDSSRQHTGIYVASLDSNDVRLLFKAETSIRYAAHPPGVSRNVDYILFVRDRALMAQPFDPNRLAIVGDATPIAEQVGISKFSVSENGALAYGTGDIDTQLTWFDRSGKQENAVGAAGHYIDFTLSPGGALVAAQREDGLGGADIWLLDLARASTSRLTFYPTYNLAPVWWPDGSHVTFSSIREGQWQIYEKLATGGNDDQLLLKTANNMVPDDRSANGKFLLYTELNPKTPQGDVWVLPTQTSSSDRARPTPFVHTEFDENFARFSPDSKWVAYQSNESGRYEIYVQPIRSDGTAGEGKWQISTNGGIEPRWPRRSNEIFYIAPDNMLMSVSVKSTGAAFEVGVPRPLFAIRSTIGLSVLRYDATADGQRFLVARPLEGTTSSPATVVLNWPAAVK